MTHLSTACAGDLAHALSFTPQDLAANRQGRLSPRQAACIRQVVNRDVARTITLCVAAFIILALLFNTPGVEGILWALLLSGVPLIASFLRLLPLSQDAAHARTEPVSGEVSAERWLPPFARRFQRLLRLRPGYYLSVGGDRFHVDRRTYQAFEQMPGGRAYTLYHTPAARIVVAIE
jgi:hypothetical protein